MREGDNRERPNSFNLAVREALSISVIMSNQ